MKGSSRLFELYLLGSMRGATLVDAALRKLGAARDDLPTTRQIVVDAGLERPDARLDDYERLFGKAHHRVLLQDAGEYERVKALYRLDTWPGMHVVVLGSADGVVGGIRFERADADPVSLVHRLGELVPWNHVRSDLMQTSWRLTARDEWYPMLDLVAEDDGTAERALLQFDFDLLQVVSAC